MKILAIPVRLLANTNAARPAQHTINVADDPLCLAQEFVFAKLVVELDQKHDTEGVRPQIA